MIRHIHHDLHQSGFGAKDALASAQPTRSQALVHTVRHIVQVGVIA